MNQQDSVLFVVRTFHTFHIIFAFPSSVTHLLEHLLNVACGEDAVIEMKITQYRWCKI